MNRQHFNQFGKPKRPFNTPKDARRVRDIINHNSMFKAQVYKCKVCGKYHLGNKEYYKVMRAMKKHDEDLIGKLVHALRLVLDKPTDS